MRNAKKKPPVPKMPPRPAGVSLRLHEFLADVLKAAHDYEHPEERFPAIMRAVRWSADPEAHVGLVAEETLIFNRWLKLYMNFLQATLRGSDVALRYGNQAELLELCLAIICFRRASHPLPENLFFLDTRPTANVG